MGKTKVIKPEETLIFKGYDIDKEVTVKEAIEKCVFELITVSNTSILIIHKDPKYMRNLFIDCLSRVPLFASFSGGLNMTLDTNNKVAFNNGSIIRFKKDDNLRCSTMGISYDFIIFSYYTKVSEVNKYILPILKSRKSRIQKLKYAHHNIPVWVRADLKGKHRDYCLCYECKKFKPNTSENCPIAQAVYENCVKFGITTPMWECPDWED